MPQKPSVAKGTRDFSPIEMSRRNYIFNTIKEVYKRYGFQQIETPAMENLQTLLGKYGEEGDKLLFRILNSGDFLSKVSPEMLEERDALHLSSKICEKGLRYDLTVPFARYVVMHRQELELPFKRYQIQPVWRADRPQRGRYREFYQCDADVVGSDSLLNEVELIQIFDEVFTKLGIDVDIRLNNRKILAGIAETVGEPDKIVDITIAIDKLDKIGLENVNQELLAKGLTQQAVDGLQPILLLSGTNEEKLDTIEKTLSQSETGLKGVDEVRQILQSLNVLKLTNKLTIDLTLARGLNYYTGAIFEVKAIGAAMGSIAGGGRYDNLTGIFGMPGLSGVGISFGADRIYDILNEKDLYPSSIDSDTQLLFVNFGSKEVAHILPMLKQIRNAGIASEIYPDEVKIKKQMAYANAKHIPFVAIVGENEIAQEKVTLKDMTTGEQAMLGVGEIIEKLTNK